MDADWTPEHGHDGAYPLIITNRQYQELQNSWLGTRTSRGLLEAVDQMGAAYDGGWILFQNEIGWKDVSK